MCCGRSPTRRRPHQGCLLVTAPQSLPLRGAHGAWMRLGAVALRSPCCGTRHALRLRLLQPRRHGWQSCRRRQQLPLLQSVRQAHTVSWLSCASTPLRWRLSSRLRRHGHGAMQWVREVVQEAQLQQLRGSVAAVAVRGTRTAGLALVETAAVARMCHLLSSCGQQAAVEVEVGGAVVRPLARLLHGHNAAACRSSKSSCAMSPTPLQRLGRLTELRIPQLCQAMDSVGLGMSTAAARRGRTQGLGPLQSVVAGAPTLGWWSRMQRAWPSLWLTRRLAGAVRRHSVMASWRHALLVPVGRPRCAFVAGDGATCLLHGCLVACLRATGKCAARCGPPKTEALQQTAPPCPWAHRHQQQHQRTRSAPTSLRAPRPVRIRLRRTVVVRVVAGCVHPVAAVLVAALPAPLLQVHRPPLAVMWGRVFRTLHRAAAVAAAVARARLPLPLCRLPSR
jgi:hypothetical protein